MEVYGQLIAAGFERRTSDPAGADLFTGRAWMRTDLATDQYRVYDGSQIEIFADTQSAQTFQNKILTGANISDFLEFDQQGSTPANPAAGKSRVYPKADGVFYTLAPDGTELPLGSGSGGSKNYFEDADARIDSNIGAWETDDGAGSPSGGLSLAVTAVAGELLEGSNSLKVAKDAADRNGHFVKVLSKTIDPADRGRPNYGSFEFRPLTGYVSSDLVWEVYDVTNAAVLYSGPASSLELLNSQGRFNWVTYLADDTEQVEFRLKVDNTNTNGFDVVVDEFTFGPAAQLNAPIVTEWQEYSLVIGGSGGTPPTPNPDYQQANWRRVGDSMEITFNYLQSVAGASGAGTSYTFSLPPGYQMDAAKWYPGFGNGTQGSCGTAIVQSTSRGVQEGWIQPLNNTEFIIYTGDAVDNHAIMGAAYNPFGDATIRISFRAVVPIVGWGAGAVLSGNELSLKTLSVLAISAGNVNFSSGATNDMIYELEQKDTHGAYDHTTGIFTAPFDGEFTFDAQSSFSSLTAGTGLIEILLTDISNSVLRRERKIINDSTVTVDVSSSLLLNKGEQVKVRLVQTNGAGRVTTASTSGYHALSIKGVPDFTVIGAVDDQNYYEAPEQDLPGTISWNSATPGGTLVKKYKWFQKGKIVDFFFWWDYSGAPAGNDFAFFDLPPDLPIPSIQNANSTQSSHAGSAQVGNGGSIGEPATCHYINASGRIYISMTGSVSSNEVHGHLRYYID